MGREMGERNHWSESHTQGRTITLLSAWGLDKSGLDFNHSSKGQKSREHCNTPTCSHSTLKLQKCRHSCQWVLSKEFKGSSVFLPFTGQANQLGTSFKLGSEPSSSSSWIQDIQFLILLYVRQEKTAPGGTPRHPMLPAHPQLSNDTAAVSKP